MKDKQIKNYPKCTKCQTEWKSPETGGVPLVYYHTALVCGNCLTKIQQKMNKWIQEIEV